MSDELKACPSGHNTVYVAEWVETFGDLSIKNSQVRCDCGFYGPKRFGDDSRAEAIKAWNTRTQPQPRKVSVDKMLEIMNKAKSPEYNPGMSEYQFKLFLERNKAQAIVDYLNGEGEG